MGEPLTLPTDVFDAVISVGVLTVGHAPAGSLDELVRITRPGVHIVFTLRPDVYQNNGFKEKQLSLESARKWRLVEVSQELQTMPNGEPDVYSQIWVYQVTTTKDELPRTTGRCVSCSPDTGPKMGGIHNCPGLRRTD